MERWLFAIVVRTAAPSWRTRTTAWSAWRTTRPVFHKQPNRPVAQKQHNQPVLKHRAKSSLLVGKMLSLLNNHQMFLFLLQLQFSCNARLPGGPAAAASDPAKSLTPGGTAIATTVTPFIS